MKIRTGFVANSSSSSFILAGKRVSLQDVIDNPDNEYLCLGDWLCEGSDVFPFSLEYARAALAFGWNEHVIVEKYIYEPDTSGGVEIDIPVAVWGGQADYHYTSSLEEFMEKYIDTEDVIESFIKEKLNEIQK